MWQVLVSGMVQMSCCCLNTGRSVRVCWRVAWSGNSTKANLLRWYEGLCLGILQVFPPLVVMYCQRSCAVVPGGSCVSLSVCCALSLSFCAVLVAVTMRTESFPIMVLQVWSILLRSALSSYWILAFCQRPTRDHWMLLILPNSSKAALISDLVVPSGISLTMMVCSSSCV